MRAAAVGVLGVSPFLSVQKVVEAPSLPPVTLSVTSPVLTPPEAPPLPPVALADTSPVLIEPEVLPEPAPLWENDDRPSLIVIPAAPFVGLEIQPADLTPNGETYVVPNDGIATPRSPHGENFVYVYGHSRWQGERKSFANISNLEPGDSVYVGKEGEERVVEFKVESFQLVNIKEDTSTFFSYEEPTLLLQTTAKSGDGWILEKDKIIQKSGKNVPQSLDGYLVYVVVAKPVRR